MAAHHARMTSTCGVAQRGHRPAWPRVDSIQAHHVSTRIVAAAIGPTVHSIRGRRPTLRSSAARRRAGREAVASPFGGRRHCRGVDQRPLRPFVRDSMQAQPRIATMTSAMKPVSPTSRGMRYTPICALPVRPERVSSRSSAGEVHANCIGRRFRRAPRRGCRPWTPRREGIRYTPRCRPGLPRAPGTHLVEVAVPARSSKCWGLVEPERLRRHRAQCEIDRFAFRREPVATHDLGASLVANVDIGACHVYRMHQKGTKSTPAFRGARLDYGYEWSLAYGQPARSSRFPSRSRRCIRTATLDRWNACAGNCRINPSCRYSSTGVQHGQTRREATERASRDHTGGAGDQSQPRTRR